LNDGRGAVKGEFAVALLADPVRFVDEAVADGCVDHRARAVHRGQVGVAGDALIREEGRPGDAVGAVEFEASGYTVDGKQTKARVAVETIESIWMHPGTVLAEDSETKAGP
jgi:hypothetical protein